MAEYEKLRQKTIEQNRIRMKDLGVTSMAYEMKQSMKGSKQTKKRKKVTKDTAEYTPDEEGELNHSSEEDENEIRKNAVNLRSRSKKVVALRGKITTNTKDTACVSSVPMANQIKMHLQDTERQHSDQGLQGRDSTQRKIQLGKSTAQKKSGIHNQQEKEVGIGNGIQTKAGQSKTVVAPGSLSAYRQMQTQLREKERRAKQSDLLLRRQLRPVNMTSSQPVNMASSDWHLGSSQAQSFSQPQRFGHDLQEDYENHMGSNERILEQYDDEEDAFSEDLSTLIPEELGIMQDVPLMNQEQESEQIAPQKSKRTRGPTMCKDVHEWTLEERKPIVINEMGKPIGPDDKTVNTFKRFLGTLARNSSLAPLNKISWHYVPDKEQIWSYVTKKYIISEKGKDCVLTSVGRLWRRYKCSVKATHFTPYDNDGDRLANPPNTILEAHFKELLEFWNLEPVQEDSQKKREISIDKKDRHTMGPMTLARKQHKLQQLDVEKKPPSLALMYKESRKRKADKKYKTSYEPTQSNIDKMEEVQIQSEIDGDVAYYEVMNKPNNFGHRKKQPGICSLRGKSNNPIIPDEFLKPYKDQIMKETVAELMKMLKQSDPKVLDTLTRSLENVSSNPELTDHIPIVHSNEQQRNEDQTDEDEELG